MTTKTHAQVMNLVEAGAIEVISWFVGHNGNGIVEVRRTKTNKRMTWEVEQIPANFKG